MTFDAPFTFGQRVYLDDDRELIAIVTGLMWRDCDGVSVEVSYLHNGDAKSAWMHPWRLTLAPARDKGSMR